jgi:hypothetical protein
VTDADIVERVNAWITARQRQGWASGSNDRSTAIAWWMEVARRYAADSPPALGCLLNLVRVAWDEPNASAVRVCVGAGTREAYGRPDGAEDSGDGGWSHYEWTVSNRAYGVPLVRTRSTEIEALITCLEAAP